jgi:hypothetical protein
LLLLAIIYHASAALPRSRLTYSRPSPLRIPTVSVNNIKGGYEYPEVVRFEIIVSRQAVIPAQSAVAG